MPREDGEVLWDPRRQVPFRAPHWGARVPRRGTGAYRCGFTRAFAFAP